MFVYERCRVGRKCRDTLRERECVCVFVGGEKKGGKALKYFSVISETDASIHFTKNEISFGVSRSSSSQPPPFPLVKV